ncbi:Nucleotidyltransferase [Schizophyllum commune H4-8]|uniref:Nucleotidyltransferase n=1 Tax=Schizophyllum commune (strain H4-8 / FGSC 9210) TaxID=578458 RepID=UPI00215E20B9|nr:Nucleotidyltransferase [Schizophyllum commune H4-8]KAI5885394.1 Nucleotidyltransferase [Schizophyllum commune H4-8]
MSRAGPSSSGSRSLLQRISSPPPLLDHNAASGPSHDNSRKRQRKRKRETPPPEMLYTPWLDLCRDQFSRCESAMDKLHYEILAYERYMAPTPQENEARSRTQSLIMNALRDLPCVGRLQLFGSSAIGIVTPTSDLDMVNENSRLAQAGQPACIDALWAIGRRLRQRGIVSEFNVNKWARVPIITFATRPEFGPFDVDIGVNNVDGLNGVPIMQKYLRTMPALRPLLFVLKRFLGQRDLGNAAKSGLGGYGLMCLIVAFLKNNPQGRPQSYIDSPLEERSLGILLQDFLEFYGTKFDYEALYIAPEEGAYLPKEEGEEWLGDLEKAANRLVIKCPVTPGHDVARSAGRTAQIVDAFAAGLSIIQEANLADETILGALIGVPQKVIDRRVSLRHLVDSGGYGRTYVAPQYQPYAQPRRARPPSPPRGRYPPYRSHDRPPPSYKRPRHDYY